MDRTKPLIMSRNGWLETARRSPSPNCDSRPDDSSIDLLVIHNISLPPGEFNGHWIEDFFLNRLNPDDHPYFQEIQGLHVSSHLLIRRDGSLIQFVPFGERAWHAGQSHFDGRDACNDFSIGIELEGTDDLDFEDAQYAVLAQVTQALMGEYPGITGDRITGHSTISPDRKTDPGPCFDWARYHRDLSTDPS